MRELEMESAELLPSRETLCCCRGGYPSHGGTTIVQQGYGNQQGLLNIGVANGSFDNILSLGSGTVI
jgi:hypothetical protein